MPFDYNSFFQGVQTGLRLGRTSPGRVPPMPPVPSGKYILTESDVPVITEGLNPPTDASLYLFERWYPATLYDGPYPDSQVEEAGIEFKVTQIYEQYGLYYFYWQGAYYDDRFDFVVVSELDLTGFNITGYKRENEESEEEFVFTGGIAIPDRAGAYYYYAFPPAVCKCRPDGMTPFVGSREELEAFISGIKHHRLITEGGG